MAGNIFRCRDLLPRILDMQKQVPPELISIFGPVGLDLCNDVRIDRSSTRRSNPAFYPPSNSMSSPPADKHSAL
jgi:hypothetical protein